MQLFAIGESSIDAASRKRRRFSSVFLDQVISGDTRCFFDRIGVGLVHYDLRTQVAKFLVCHGMVHMAVRVDHPADVSPAAATLLHIRHRPIELRFVSRIYNDNPLGATIDHIGQVANVVLADEIYVAGDSGWHRNGLRRGTIDKAITFENVLHHIPTWPRLGRAQSFAEFSLLPGFPIEDYLLAFFSRQDRMNRWKRTFERPSESAKE